MSKIIAAVVTALLAIGVITVLTGLTEEVEANVIPTVTKGDRLDIRPNGSGCVERAWPYYDARCLRDRRPAADHVRSVRLVSADRLSFASAEISNVK